MHQQAHKKSYQKNNNLILDYIYKVSTFAVRILKRNRNG
jgi:hypothetical protein